MRCLFPCLVLASVTMPDDHRLLLQDVRFLRQASREPMTFLQAELEKFAESQTPASLERNWKQSGAEHQMAFIAQQTHSEATMSEALTSLVRDIRELQHEATPMAFTRMLKAEVDHTSSSSCRDDFANLANVVHLSGASRRRYTSSCISSRTHAYRSPLPPRTISPISFPIPLPNGGI